jgi:hypothetical protein
MQQKLPIQLKIPITEHVEQWVPIPVRISQAMLAEVDRLGLSLRESRSEFIRVALAERIERQSQRRFGNEHIMPDRRGVGGRPKKPVSAPASYGDPRFPASVDALKSNEDPPGGPSSKAGIDPGDPVALFHAAMPLVEEAWERAGLGPLPRKKGTRPPLGASQPPPDTGRQSSPSPRAPKPVRAAKGPSGSSGS